MTSRQTSQMCFCLICSGMLLIPLGSHGTACMALGIASAAAWCYCIARTHICFGHCSILVLYDSLLLRRATPLLFDAKCCCCAGPHCYCVLMQHAAALCLFSSVIALPFTSSSLSSSTCCSSTAPFCTATVLLLAVKLLRLAVALTHASNGKH